MKYRKYFFIPIIFILFDLTETSCKKDFLDTPPSTIVTRQEYVTDLNSTGNFLNGVFTDLAQYLYTGLSVIYPDLIADNIKPFTGQTSLISQYNWAQIAGEGGNVGLDAARSDMNGLWISAFRVIRNANYTIENAEKFKNENSAKADSLKAQALVLRVLAYFELVNVFAQPYKYTGDASHPGIPYVYTSDFTQGNTPRQTVAQVYTSMIDDLNNAIPYLPSINQPVNKLIVTQMAGKALLARVYLFEGNYSNAKNISREISAKIPIMPAGSNGYPSKLFTSQETEALFQLPPEQTSFIAIFPSYYFKASKKFVATNDIATILYERSNDVRKNWLSFSAGSWNITKFPSGVVANQTYPDMAYYYTVIRSSEMYLTASECYSKLGNDDSARYYLDAIRKRADPTASISTANGTALLDSIYKERRKELCFENLRMFDLLRIGKNVSRIDAPSSVNNLHYPNNKAIAPIPVLDVRQSGIDQNLDY